MNEVVLTSFAWHDDLGFVVKIHAKVKLWLDRLVDRCDACGAEASALYREKTIAGENWFCSVFIDKSRIISGLILSCQPIRAHLTNSAPSLHLPPNDLCKHFKVMELNH